MRANIVCPARPPPSGPQTRRAIPGIKCNSLTMDVPENASSECAIAKTDAKIIAHSVLIILASGCRLRSQPHHSVKFDSTLSTWDESSSAGALRLICGERQLSIKRSSGEYDPLVQNDCDRGWRHAALIKTTARCSASPVVPHTLQILDSNLPPDSFHFG
jgi:hypothetical protein